MVEKKLVLIQRLLAKAESTTPEEAAALTEAAEKLMVKFGIDQAMIDAKRAADEKPEPIVEQRVVWKTSHAVGYRMMATAVAGAFPTIKILRSGSKNYEVLYLIGFESEVQQVKLLIESLTLQVVVALSAWWKTFDRRSTLTGHEQHMAKRQFMYAFGLGAADRIRLARTEAVKETTGAEVALRDRAALVEEALSERYPSLRKGRAPRGSLFGHAEGRAAGRAANVGQAAVRGSRTAITR